MNDSIVQRAIGEVGHLYQTSIGLMFRPKPDKTSASGVNRGYQIGVGLAGRFKELLWGYMPVSDDHLRQTKIHQAFEEIKDRLRQADPDMRKALGVTEAEIERFLNAEFLFQYNPSGQQVGAACIALDDFPVFLFNARTESLDYDEVRAIVAHEIGHYFQHLGRPHILIPRTIMQAQGRVAAPTVVLAIAAGMNPLTLAPLLLAGTALGGIEAAITRIYEHGADRFAQTLVPESDFRKVFSQVEGRLSPTHADSLLVGASRAIGRVQEIVGAVVPLPPFFFRGNSHPALDVRAEASDRRRGVNTTPGLEERIAAPIADGLRKIGAHGLADRLDHEMPTRWFKNHEALLARAAAAADQPESSPDIRAVSGQAQVPVSSHDASPVSEG